MHKFISSTALALAMALTSVPLSGASAQDLELHLGNNGPQLRLRRDCDPDREDCRDRGDYRRDRDRRDDQDRYANRRQCSPDRALDKADRMGVRRARIDRIGRRTIDVRGWRDGERVTLSFDRWDSRCRLLD
ncbi:MAG: hypothetical protein J0I98_02980 [Mesorhizobium sp.]|nr:hypothetical protein [Mesorhizobium sp.]MBN9241739.1 hypothetical protein [Mesorhizobium sp.]